MDNKKGGLPIADDSEVFDLFDELEKERCRYIGVPQSHRQGDSALDDLIFVEDSGPPSAEEFFFGDSVLEDDSKESS
ncbi:MAG: hypothetical protein P1P90_06405 [Patescibacteria group bacterium]|nr:hypothetical protein [Patescibacteria group bacterium]